MTKKCELTGKRPLKGHKVSHANNKVKRRFLPGIKNADKSLFSTIDNPYVLSFSTAAGKESIERQEYWKNLAINHFKSLMLVVEKDF